MTTINYDSLFADRSQRDQYSDRVEVLDEVKELPVLKGDLVTINMAADYFDVSKDSVTKLFYDNKDELTSVGAKKLEGESLNQFKEAQRSGGDEKAFFKINTLIVFPREAVIRVAMLLRGSEVARQVRMRLLSRVEVPHTEAATEQIDNHNHEVSTINNEKYTADIGENLKETVHAAIKYQHETMQQFIQQQNDVLRQLITGQPR